MRVYAHSVVGNVRAINEDSFYVPKFGERFMAVADGMGGHNAGEIASAMAIEAFQSVMRKTKPADVTLSFMRSVVEYANQMIFQESQRDDAKSGMGTTFTGAVFKKDRAAICHVGDSRAYLIHDKSILRLSTDHTLVEELFESGAITYQETKTHPQRNVITRALGTEKTIKVDVFYVDIHPGDVLLLCSDGLHGVIDDADLLRIITAENDPHDIPGILIDTALENGSRDNITCVLAYIGKEAE